MEAIEGALADLLEASHHLPPDEVPAAAAAAAQRIGATDTVIFLVDPEERVLVPLARDDVDLVEIDGTMAGRAFIASETQETSEGGVRLHVPMLDGPERLGVIRFDVPAVDDETRRSTARLAALVAELVMSKDRYTDLYRIAARQHEMTLAAEMQWQALPPRTFSSPRVGLSGTLHPAYEVGGDAYDYASNGGFAELAIFDSMGHGLRSSVLANLALGAFRSARRRGLGLSDTYLEIDRAIQEVFDDVRFVTGILGRLDLESGLLRWVNAGHQAPLLVRQGRVVGPLTSVPSLPMGLGGQPMEVTETSLEQGDRVLLYTDGVVDAHEPGGEPFGEERLSELLSRHVLDGLGPAETLRRLTQAVLAHHGDRLRDDATMLFVERR